MLTTTFDSARVHPASLIVTVAVPRRGREAQRREAYIGAGRRLCKAGKYATLRHGTRSGGLVDRAHNRGGPFLRDRILGRRQ